MHPVWLLAAVTLVIVLVAAVYQLRSVRHSQSKRGEQPGATTMKRHASREAPHTETTHSAAAAESPNARITHPDENEIRSPQEIRASLDAAGVTPGQRDQNRVEREHGARPV